MGFLGEGDFPGFLRNAIPLHCDLAILVVALQDGVFGHCPNVPYVW